MIEEKGDSSYTAQHACNDYQNVMPILTPHEWKGEILVKAIFTFIIIRPSENKLQGREQK